MRRRGQWLRQGGFIYLRTGGNGSGKTLFTLHDVRAMQVKENRPVYFVEGRFTPRPVLTEEFGWRPIKFEDWEQCEKGAIILCDEVHYDLPNRAQTKAPPLHIQRLTEHRKFGYDFFMLTQHPSNFDAFVRKLVQAPGYHMHFKRILGGTASSSCLQWDAVNPNCEKDGSGRTAQITNRAFPKEVYGWYESAEKHTAKVRIPKQVYTLIGCIVAFIAVCYLLVTQFMPGSTAGAEKPGASGNPTASGIVSAPVVGPAPSERQPMTALEYAMSYQPRIEGLQHTAPAYDDLTRPQRVPVPAACVDMASKGCKCYTQDATPYPVPDGLCRQLVAHGAWLAFNPDPNRQQPSEAPARPPATPEAPPAPSAGFALFEAPARDVGRPAAQVASSGAQVAQPRVPASSPWSFQALAQ